MSQLSARITLAILCLVLVVGAVQAVQNWDARRQAAPNQALNSLYDLWLGYFDAAEAVPLLEEYLETGERDTLLVAQRILLGQANEASEGFTMYFGRRHQVRLDDTHPLYVFSHAMVVLDRILQPERYEEPLSSDDEFLIVETIIEELTWMQRRLELGHRPPRLVRDAAYIKSLAERSLPVLAELADDVGVTLPRRAR